MTESESKQIRRAIACLCETIEIASTNICCAINNHSPAHDEDDFTQTMIRWELRDTDKEPI